MNDNQANDFFIYALKDGAHFNYSFAYPAIEAVFKPDFQERELKTDITKLRNSYYNAVRWNVDGFFKYLLKQLNGQDVTIIYTSDHGQGLHEDGTGSTHCKPENPHSAQANVPLIVLPLGNDYIKFSELASEKFSVNKGSVSAFVLFPTLLHLQGYAPDKITRDYHLSIFDELNAERYFFSGDIWGTLRANKFEPHHQHFGVFPYE